MVHPSNGPGVNAAAHCRRPLPAHTHGMWARRGPTGPTGLRRGRRVQHACTTSPIWSQAPRGSSRHRCPTCGWLVMAGVCFPSPPHALRTGSRSMGLLHPAPNAQRPAQTSMPPRSSTSSTCARRRLQPTHPPSGPGRLLNPAYPGYPAPGPEPDPGSARNVKPDADDIDTPKRPSRPGLYVQGSST